MLAKNYLQEERKENDNKGLKIRTKCEIESKINLIILKAKH